ncbi:MAG TPA: hypothetical protein VFW50_18505 [Streptosporangiaceae bacterium]|nr:hypothetical protein [Streptosporangiaceae bacterium]
MGTGPVLGPAQLTALGILAAIIVVALLGTRHRRATAGSRSRDENTWCEHESGNRRTHA